MKSVSPIFSIITICLNNKAGLIRTYESLKAQSCNDYEWIVIDGVSTDGTVEFLKTLPKSSMFIWKSEPDSGLYDAMNKGMDLAQGEYLLFLNSGDYLFENNVINNVKSVIDKDDPDLIYGDACEYFGLESDLLMKKSKSHNWLWYGMFTHHQSMFYKSSIVGSLKYRLEYKIAADYAFTTEVLKRANKINYIPIPICVFEGGGLTSSRAAHILGMKEQWCIGRSLQNKSILFSFATLLAHLAKHLAIRLLPSVVKKLRYSSNGEKR